MRGPINYKINIPTRVGKDEKREKQHQDRVYLKKGEIILEWCKLKEGN